MSFSTIQYESLIAQIEKVLQDLQNRTAEIQDNGARRRLIDTSRKLASSLELPRDTAHRIGYSHLQLPLVVVGVETNLFSYLSSTPQPMKISDIAEKTGVNHGLMERLLRYYQAIGIIAQIDTDSYQSTGVTRALSNEDYANSLRWISKLPAEGSLHLIDWLEARQYQDPVGILPTAMTSAMHMNKNPHEWLGENLWALKLAQAHMKTQRDGRPLFFDALDFKDRFGQNSTSSTVLFVDIGGSKGPQSRALRRRYPDLAGRVILQDRPEVIEQAKTELAAMKIEGEVYNMFTPQPIKAARAYYLRNILHAWDDATCVKILLNVKAGLTHDSVILIDELVLPERNCTMQGAELDLEIMIAVGGIERTRSQWERLLYSAGLKILEVVNYDTEFEDSVIIAKLQ